MGRKSKAKRKNRKKEEEDPKKKSKTRKTGSKKKSPKKASAKTVKQSPKKTKASKAAKSSKSRKLTTGRFFFGVFTVLMLIIIFFLGKTLFEKAFRPAPIARLLPSQNTILTLEINSNLQHNQNIKALELLKNYPQYSRTGLENALKENFNINVEIDFYSWAGRSIGFALLNSKNDLAPVMPFYFAEISNQKNLNEVFEDKNAVKTEYRDFPIYALENQAGALTIIEDYLFYSEDQLYIKELLDFRSGDFSALYYDKSYRRVDDNLPLNKAAFLYFNFGNIKNSFLNYFEFLGESGVSMDKISLFKSFFSAEGMALIATDENFIMQSFLSMNVDNDQKGAYISHIKKYNAELLSLLSSDIVAFWGGEDLNYQLNRILNIITKGEQNSRDFFDSLIQNFTQKYFGAETSFVNDILPLFENEFVFAIEKSDDQNAYKVVLELEDPENDALKIERLANSFARVGGVIQPKVVQHTLEDGTVYSELIAVAEEIIKTQVRFNGVEVNQLKMGKRDWGVYYAFFEDKAVLSTNIDGIRSTLSLWENGEGDLKSSPVFKSQIKPLLTGSDQITYFNLPEVLPQLFPENLPDYLKIFNNLSSGKNYFNDGIVSINYLSID